MLFTCIMILYQNCLWKMYTITTDIRGAGRGGQGGHCPPTKKYGGGKQYICPPPQKWHWNPKMRFLTFCPPKICDFRLFAPPPAPWKAIYDPVESLSTTYDIVLIEATECGEYAAKKSLPRFLPVTAKHFIQIVNCGDHWVCVTNVCLIWKSIGKFMYVFSLVRASREGSIDRNWFGPISGE